MPGHNTNHFRGKRGGKRVRRKGKKKANNGPHVNKYGKSK